jgi:hypothetical protein
VVASRPSSLINQLRTVVGILQPELLCGRAAEWHAHERVLIRVLVPGLDLGARELENDPFEVSMDVEPLAVEGIPSRTVFA